MERRGRGEGQTASCHVETFSCENLERGGSGVRLGKGRGGGGSHSAEEKGHFAISSFSSGLRVEMNVSIASRPSTTVDDDSGGEAQLIDFTSSESSGLFHHA